MSRIIKDDIEKFFEYGIYPDTRTIYIGSNDGSNEDEVNAVLAERAIKGLHILDLPKSAKKDITVLLNTPGGDEYAGLAIYDAIRFCQSFVRVKVLGQAASMGSIILQAGDERVLSPNSIVMIHYGTPVHVDPDSPPQTNYNWMAEDARFSKWMEDLYLYRIRQKHPKYTRKKVKDLLNFDTILTAKEAIDLGLADKIEGESSEQ